MFGFRLHVSFSPLSLLITSSLQFSSEQPHLLRRDYEACPSLPNLGWPDDNNGLSKTSGEAGKAT